MVPHHKEFFTLVEKYRSYTEDTMRGILYEREWYEQSHNQVFSLVLRSIIGLGKRWATTSVD